MRSQPACREHSRDQRPLRPLAVVALMVAAPLLAGATAHAADTDKARPKAAPPIDYNRDIRPVLSNTCFPCHGFDAAKRKGVNQPLRLDTPEGAFADLGGYQAIVPGNPDESEFVQRITSKDRLEVMPPPGYGRRPSPREIELLVEWVRQGAPYAKHWSYVKPVRPPLPEVRNTSWPRNPIDVFLLARLEQEGLKPSPEADRPALIRRVSLDLVGLPPTPEEVERFARDPSPDAYERLVDRLLAAPAFGEHWARKWLDLARYADSAGYADDPPRTIWAYRDYVIRALNANKPLDQFTVEQLAGDLLPNPTNDQLIATAFHRNTLTNNEGGTSDEEFRNVAIVDRVNTTMYVWMGTTMACAQCHDHKYDPLAQKEYFQLFALFNNTADADRTDESPVLPLFTAEQKRQKSEWEREIAHLEDILRTPTPALRASQAQWEEKLAAEPSWRPLEPTVWKSQSGAKMTPQADRSVRVEPAGASKGDVYTVDFPVGELQLTALRLEVLPDEASPEKKPEQTGGFVVSRVLAKVTPPNGARPEGRYVRVELPGKEKILSLAEVQVFRESENLAPKGTVRQSSTAFGGDAGRAIDGKTDGRYFEGNSTTHTEESDDPWWEVDLRSTGPIDRIVLWNRTDNGLHTRLSDFRVTLLDEHREPVWSKTVAAPPNPSAELAVGGARPLEFAAAFADGSQAGFEAANVLDNKDVANRGWSVTDPAGKPHALTLLPADPVAIEPGSTLTVTIEQLSKREKSTIRRFRVAASDDDRAGEFARTPEAIRSALKTAPGRRTEAHRTELTRHYLAEVAPELSVPRERLATLKKQLAELKPVTTVPVMRELPDKERRTTRIQLRGNYLALGPEVQPGVPAAFHPLPKGTAPDRLALARWLVDEANPLTARVLANRTWEQVFGIGIVPTSEDFGLQGELPTHPELLDWLATELVRQHWDFKRFLRLLVTSAAYRQDARVTPELLHRDPDNHLLARGPRFRLNAETVRDQALAVAGLLSPKMYGPPVKPPQPSLGLNAAFGSGIDWQTSQGADRYRRGLYTTWRRSNPYPSMTTFDAPNREVCTLRRSRTNTPLQALVTLNDPVYIEAAQGLARRMMAGGATPEERARFGFRICLARDPHPDELRRLVGLYEAALARFSRDPDDAQKMATDPLGPAPPGAPVAELAAWTVVGNVLLNLDEMLMKR